MASTDIDILRAAQKIESRPTAPRLGVTGKWSYYQVGATRQDLQRLTEQGLCEVVSKAGGQNNFKLTDKGRNVLWAADMDRKMEVIPAEVIIDAMSPIIGFDDVKETIARSIEGQKRIHFLLEGPPACSKSMILDALRYSVPKAEIAFGSRTSGSGLSDLLFEKQPTLLLLDEADKMRMDLFSVCLGLMESGEIIETKSKKTRGIRLQTMVIAACNSSRKMPPEFLSRFAAHLRFPEYTPTEFFDVCRGYLVNSGVPEDIADLIGRGIYDNGFRDVRQARAVWNLMSAPTVEEVARAIEFKLKWSPDLDIQRRIRRQQEPVRMAGM